MTRFLGRSQFISDDEESCSSSSCNDFCYEGYDTDDAADNDYDDEPSTFAAIDRLIEYEYVSWASRRKLPDGTHWGWGCNVGHFRQIHDTTLDAPSYVCKVQDGVVVDVPTSLDSLPQELMDTVFSFAGLCTSQDN